MDGISRCLLQYLARALFWWGSTVGAASPSSATYYAVRGSHDSNTKDFEDRTNNAIVRVSKQSAFNNTTLSSIVSATSWRIGSRNRQ